MPSKYKAKHPKKKIEKQGKEFLEIVNRILPRCTNCGRESSLMNPQFSKCYCGGTFQTYGANK